MGTDWVRQFEHLSKWVGFTINPEMRAQNVAFNNDVHENTPAWVRAVDMKSDDTMVDPFSPADLRNEFENQIHDLGPMRAFLYNMGMSHVMTNYTVESFTDRKPNTAIGEFLYSSNLAITEDRINGYGDEESVTGVARHEAGHGLSYNISAVPFLRRAVIEDFKALDLDALRPDQREIIEEFINDEYKYFGANRPHPSALFSSELYQKMGCLILSDALKDDPTLRAHFPNTSPLFDDLGLYGEDPVELLSKLSEHPSVKEAYRADLMDILEGNGPLGARIEVREIEFRGEMKDRALIIIGEGDNEVTFNAHHYLPEEFFGHEIGGSHDFYVNDEGTYFSTHALEEALADTFEDVFGTEITNQDLATYFPRLRAEVEGIKQALDVLAEREKQ